MPENVNTLAVGYDDSNVKVWDLRALHPVAVLNDKNSFESVSNLAFSKSGRIIFVSHAGKRIISWDLMNE